MQVSLRDMNNQNNRPLALIILDGWGHSDQSEGNAIALANTPFYDEISATYPKTTLAAAGNRVGLANGVAGSSEVGHLNLGAGRVVQTNPLRISEAIKSGSFFENQVLQGAFGHASNEGTSVHLVGLLSDGDVHSSSDTLFALLRMAKNEGISDVFVHAILDGRDVPQRTADIYVEALEVKMADIGVGRIATLCGRYFAMDSRENWERTARAFTMLVHAEGERAFDAKAAVRNSFLRGLSDEFVAPIVLENLVGEPVATIKEGDTVIFFNHRADTMRQLCRSVAVPDYGSLSTKPRVNAVCLTEYDRSFNLPVAFEVESQSNMLTHVLGNNRIPNYRIAESDRIAHVVNFFNGGANQSSYEQHVHVPSGSSASRDTEPELQSFKIADQMLQALENDEDAVFIVNLVAADVFAESGSLEKTVEAIQYIDTCLGGIVETIRQANGVALITSSHGHCEGMTADDDGKRNRRATTNDVPFHLVDDTAGPIMLRRDGSLQDVAPTILGLLGLEQPPEMTGKDLRLA
ncbi:MAG TPA: 2,3-bisphosphoglycerate-independent phosphoglycerate mutase [Pyrinomonadaceae bacterium]|jgi:2,3-bisphosphoglycerate-independent phosphoglycerate mutase|nr:2,3-bisphosphoglycerate-independent phosphoglycerate mutase [Pyrinomonadaceae bacterium]